MGREELEQKQEGTSEKRLGDNVQRGNSRRKNSERKKASPSVTKRAFLQYHSYNPRYFPLCFLWTVFREISPYFNLWMSAEIVTALYEGREKRELYVLVAVTLLGNFCVQAFQAFLGKRMEKALEILRDNEQRAFYRKTLSLDYDKMENPEIRRLRRKIRENSSINSYGVENMRGDLLSLMSCIVNLSFCVIFLGEMIPLMAAAPFHLLSLLLLGAMVGFSALNAWMSIRSNVAGSGNWNKIGDLMLEENRLGQGYDLNGMDCRIYRQQPIITELYEKLNRKHLRLFSEAAMKDFSLLFPAELVSTLAEICIYLVVCFYCTLGAFPVGSVIKYVGYMGRVVRNLVRLFFHIGSMKGNERYLKTYLEYFDIPNDMYQGSLAVEKRSDKKYDVEFRNVSFQYAGSDAYALQNISLKLKVGEKLAVVGRNGSGKTTFIKLLCRLYDPTEGEILMNDFNIRKYDYRQYLDIFSVVFQDYHLLAMPLGNNVSCEASWDEEKAERLLREVGFGERYAQMPKKLETPLYKNFDEDGVIVSGGEAQKIALARALYRDASFIILDEPTAALDPVAEAEIYSKFDEIVGDKTAIYISHRLSSCRFCDKIAVFDKGRIVQLGTHEELLADETGTYYELWHAQAQYYA